MSDLSLDEISILLVEPSSTQRKIIARSLHEEGVQRLDFAENAQAAIKAAIAHPPDLLISSMHFDDGSATDIIDALHEQAGLEETQYMLISSECRREQLEYFRQAGVVAILPKPFAMEHLHKALKATIDLLGHDELELEHFDVQDLRILVVDDSRFARNIIVRVMSNLGIEQITEASNGAEAISLLEGATFDLIVTDYNMPEVDGLELTNHVRKETEQSHVPILMVTSDANNANLSNVSQEGVNAMCDKPFDPATVKKLLHQLLD